VYFCVLCLIVVPLPSGKNPFAVQLNNNNNNQNMKGILDHSHEALVTAGMLSLFQLI
jgi:hypothetical protein